MSGNRDRLSTIFLAVALVGVLVFLGAYFLTGASSVGGTIALALAGVALVIYVFLRPEEVMGGLRSRQALYGGNTALMTILFLGILVAVNVFSVRQNKRWDLTAEQSFSLSPESVELVKNLQQPVTAINFASSASGGARSNAGTLLDEYRAQSNKFQVQTVDPDAQPTVARQYLASDGMIVLLSGDRHVTVSSPTESDITAALIKVTQTSQPVVYVTTGHGERSLDDTGGTGFSIVKAGLDRDGFQVKPLMLATTNTVPSDAGVVIVAGPHAKFQPSEADALKAYLARGGRVLMMVDTSLDTQDHKLGDAGLGGVLGDWGITLRDDLVLDVTRSQMNAPDIVIAANYGDSPITSKLGNLATVFPDSRSMALATQAPANVSLAALVETSQQSWGASDLDGIVKARQLPGGPGPQDAKGPLVIAATGSNSQTKGRLVIVGTSSFAVNGMSQQPGNLDLFLNAVNWLAEQESQITVRPKPFQTRQLIPSRNMSLQVFGISVVLLPLAVLVAGVIVWWRRR